MNITTSVESLKISEIKRLNEKVIEKNEDAPIDIVNDTSESLKLVPNELDDQNLIEMNVEKESTE
jgi:hypothetical protein